MTIAALAVSALALLVAAVVRAAGTALVRVARADALHDAAEGDPGAQVVADLLEDRPRLQPALGLFHTVILGVATIPATWALTRMLDGLWLLVGLGLLAVALVLLGDILPRELGRRRPRTVAYRWAGLLRPVVALGEAADEIITEENGGEEEPEEDDEDDGAERELISSVLEFGETIVREVMVPRPDMITLPATAPTDRALDVILDEGKSRIPLLGKGIDDIVGILYAKDLLRVGRELGATPVPVVDVARSPYFVPETKPVPDLLREMRTDRAHLAIVVDEYGGTAGLVTIEDLLEEIVGEISDEYDEDEQMVVALDSGGWLLDGRLPIDELDALLASGYTSDEWDTVGGFVLGLAGRVPREGESFEAEGHLFTVDRVQGRRVARVRLDGVS